MYQYIHLTVADRLKGNGGIRIRCLIAIGLAVGSRRQTLDQYGEHLFGIADRNGIHRRNGKLSVVVRNKQRNCRYRSLLIIIGIIQSNIVRILCLIGQSAPERKGKVSRIAVGYGLGNQQRTVLTLSNGVGIGTAVGKAVIQPTDFDHKTAVMEP